VYPSVCGTGTLSLSFTFTSSSQYLLYVSQATTADTTFAFGSVEQSSYGNSFYAYIDSCPTSARGIEYRVCTKKGTEVYSSYASTSSEYLYISSSAITKRTIYYIQARTYAYDSSYNKVYSGWSDKKYFISRPDVKTSATKKTLSTHSVTLKWYKVTGATKYIVYCSTKQSSGYKKVGTTTKTSLKVTKFKNKTISFTSKKYFKIIAVTKVGGKTVKSTPYYAYAQVY
nr:hypothetical protein [Eubacterium sp.]